MVFAYSQLVNAGCSPLSINLQWWTKLVALVRRLSRGCLTKKFTYVLLHTAKMINSRIKSQGRGQNNMSRALKWGIVHLCSSNTFRDTTKFMKIWVFQFLHFCKKWQNYYTKSQKLKNIKKTILLILIIISKVTKL